MVHLLSPTGKGIRGDPAGDGRYGAKRGEKTHQGTDFLCIPGQDVYAPARATILRVANPYKDSTYSGLLLDCTWCYIKLFYLQPITGKGAEVYRGQVIGIAQDVTERYKGQAMLPHIHMEVSKLSLNPEHYMIGGCE